MKVTGKYNILGRGWTLCCEGDYDKLSLGREIVVKDKAIVFTITGFGSIPGHRNFELLLSPNGSVGEFIEVGDELDFNGKELAV